MKEDEFNFINSAIKERFCRETKELIKLYQATIDGGDLTNFHRCCDNIPNTLVLIKSAGNRRFGGFTTAKWSSQTNAEYKEAPGSFLFFQINKKYTRIKILEELFMFLIPLDLLLEMIYI